MAQLFTKNVVTITQINIFPGLFDMTALKTNNVLILILLKAPMLLVEVSVTRWLLATVNLANRYKRDIIKMDNTASMLTCLDRPASVVYVIVMFPGKGWIAQAMISIQKHAMVELEIPDCQSLTPASNAFIRKSM